MQKYMLAGILVSLIIATQGLGLLSAQDDTEPLCDAAVFQDASDQITELTAQLTGSEDPLGVLEQIRNLSSQTLSQCSGLTFNSDEEGQKPVLGPIDVPEGLYRVTATTTGFLIIKTDVMNGDCEPKDSRSYLFNLSEGEADDGAQALFESQGCSVLLSFDNTQEPWVVSFEKLK